jgi:hypothetical protein
MQAATHRPASKEGVRLIGAGADNRVRVFLVKAFQDAHIRI